MNITKITRYICIYIYIYKYTDKDDIKRLRCYDINCKGTAKLTHTGKIEIVMNVKYYTKITFIKKKKLYGIK